MQAKPLVDTLGNKKADQVQTFYNTVGEVKAVVFVIKVALRIAVLKDKAHEDRLTKV